MNANELAKLLEVDSWYKLVTREEIATMLRQQQVLIENLNGRIERMTEKQSHHEAMAHAGGFEAGRELGMKQERERNNEPVAWMLADKEAEHIRSIMAVQHDFVPEGCVEIPLYTHPVKELTDFEIKGVLGLDECWIGEDCSIPDMIAFARAILRKAQEK